MWLDGPSDELWGIPDFWIIRLAKTLQFIASLVIILELIGRDRLDRFIRDEIDKLIEQLSGWKTQVNTLLFRHVLDSPLHVLFTAIHYNARRCLVLVRRGDKHALHQEFTKQWGKVKADVDVTSFLFYFALCLLVLSLLFGGLLSWQLATSALSEWAWGWWLLLYPCICLLVFIVYFVIGLPAVAIVLWLTIFIVDKVIQTILEKVYYLIFGMGISNLFIILAVVFYISAFALDMAVS